MLEVCPKCKDKAIYYDVDPGRERNTCYLCGFTHSCNGSFQSFERQITNKQDKFGIGLSISEYKTSVKDAELTPEELYDKNIKKAAKKLKKYFSHKKLDKTQEIE